MLGNLNNSTKDLSTGKTVTEAKIDKKIDALEQEIEETNERINALSEELVTETVTSTNVTATTVTANTTDSSQVIAGTVNADNILTTTASVDKVETEVTFEKPITATAIKADEVDTDNLTVTAKVPSIQIGAADIEDLTVQNTLYASAIESESYDVDVVNSDLVATKTIETENETVTGNSTIQNAKIDYLDVETVLAESTHSTEASFTTATVSTENVTTDNIETANVTTLVNGNNIGFKTVNLQPQLQTIDDYYTVKIAPDFNNLSLSVKDSFTVNFTNAKASEATRAITLINISQKQLNVVKSIIRGTDGYLYVQIAPLTVDELRVKYSAQESVDISYTYDTEPEEDYSYEPDNLSELVMFGNDTKEYQFTVMGKLKCKISPDFEAGEFAEVYIDNKLWFYTGTDPETGEKIYSNGTNGQYVGNKEGRPTWMTPLQSDDSGTIVYNSDTDKGVLITADVMANLNGKVIKDGVESYPIVHLGTVTDGTWKAGNIWLNGVEMDSATGDDYSWVLV